MRIVKTVMAAAVALTTLSGIGRATYVDACRGLQGQRLDRCINSAMKAWNEEMKKERSATMVPGNPEQKFNQEACKGSPWGEAKCTKELKDYCSTPNKWQGADGKWHEGQSPRQQGMCYQKGK